MTLHELREKLVENGVPLELYSLDGGLPHEAFCINNIDGKWEYYYSERGLKSGLITFDNEYDACDYFWYKVTHSYDVSKYINNRP